MSARVYRTSSEEETVELGRTLAREIPRPSTVLLIGDLGAGKTTLTKGIVEGLGGGTRDAVSSPTFTLLHEYAEAVYHLDLYRLEKAREVASVGLDDLLDSDDAIVLVEWGERFPELFPAARIEVRLRHAGGDIRDITVTGLA